MIRPTGIDITVKIALSLFFIIDITPSTNPTIPMIAMKGVGSGNRMYIDNVDIFIVIRAIKSNVKIADHFPNAFLE